MHPEYPIFIPSKDRYQKGRALTARMLIRDDVDFVFVVEPQDYDHYHARFPDQEIVQLPENDRGLIYARNWIRDYSTERGDKRHWQVDDNIRECMMRVKGKRIPCRGNIAFRMVERFVDRYTNVALAGMQYDFFVRSTTKRPPFVLNAHVYSNTLFLNSLPHRFREPANEDVDMCLQVLSDGWCTVLFNQFMIRKARTMTVGGGQTDTAYQGDGRLFMARALEKKWPGVVKTTRRFGRPQHKVKHEWKRFDTPLERRTDIDWDAIENDVPKLTAKTVRPVQSERIREIRDYVNEEND